MIRCTLYLASIDGGCAFASYSQTAAQESATQVSAQHESTTQQVSACSHVASLHFLLLQHELMVRAATATITNNTFFILS